MQGAAGVPQHSRRHALLALLIEVLYALVVVSFSRTVAMRFAPAAWFSPLRSVIALILLLAGFIVLGRLQHGQRFALREMGWWWRQAPERYRWQQPGGALLMGLALGWGIAVALVLPLALGAGLSPAFDFSAAAWGASATTLVDLLLTWAFLQTLFSGYLLRRLESLSSVAVAVLTMAVVVGLVNMYNGVETRAELLFSMLEQIALGVAALRTRSLWLPVGVAVCSRAALLLVFGLPVPGDSAVGVVQSQAFGPLWLTGGFAGPMGAMLAPLVALVALAVVVRMTRRDVIGEIRGAAYVVDIDSNKAPNPVHAAYNDPPPPSLVQILPVAVETPRIGPPLQRDE